jgi:molybdopterin/thiamine biosynthesis adenylyltransferase
VVPAPDPPLPDRYSRQVLFPPVGAAGQARLARAQVAIVGAGALGATLAELVVRAGIGTVSIIDRDVVEPSNLGRQALYTDEDAREGRPKAVALAEHLARFNPLVRVLPAVLDLHPGNARDRLLRGTDLILDATDNFDARYLINDVAVEAGLPWIYGACIGARGLTAVILPGETPCLRCLFVEPPPPGSAETCDTAGIIGPAATLVASLQAAEALKILVGDLHAVRRTLLSIELWPFRVVELGGPAPRPRPDCPACGRRRFEFLDSPRRAGVHTICGRDSVQVVPARAREDVDLAALERRLAPLHPVRRFDGVLRVELPGHRLTVFADGRALVGGTADPALARSLYDRIIGS